ncbi:MAG: hypothetical protein JW990_04830 [Thermoleophilia bacterium]|nr:hypothetical protein [Thermoleophilia bacterium]
MDEEAKIVQQWQEEIRNLPVSEHLLYMMHSLSALAVGRLGLTADTASRRDLDEARLAIEAFKALMEVEEQVRPQGETSIHRETLSQLQLAYVKAVEAGEAPAADAAVPTDAARPEAPPDGEAPNQGEAPKQGEAPE